MDMTSLTDKRVWGHSLFSKLWSWSRLRSSLAESGSLAGLPACPP